MVCFDTTFVIDFLKNKKEAVIKEKYMENTNELLAITAPTITELIRGLGTKHVSDDEREIIIDFISSINVLDLDKISAIKAGEIEIELEKKGEKIGVVDSMIAAITITNNEKLITRNVKHFKKIKGLETESY